MERRLGGAADLETELLASAEEGRGVLFNETNLVESRCC